MPRVKALKTEYMANDLGAYIKGVMWRQQVKQQDIAEALGVTQQAVDYKLRNNSFSYKDLLIVFRELQLPDGEILRLMKCEN